MLEDAYGSGKPVIYGGTGNGPAFIERTADIHQAVQDIIASKTFDNGVVSAAEQSGCRGQLHCIRGKASNLKQAETYFMTEEEAERLRMRLVYFKDGSANPELAGKAARGSGSLGRDRCSGRDGGTCWRSRSMYRKTIRTRRKNFARSSHISSRTIGCMPARNVLNFCYRSAMDIHW